MTDLTVTEGIISLIIVLVVGSGVSLLIPFLIHWYMLRKTEEINDIINNINKEKDI